MSKTSLSPRQSGEFVSKEDLCSRGMHVLLRHKGLEESLNRHLVGAADTSSFPERTEPGVVLKQCSYGAAAVETHP